MAKVELSELYEQDFHAWALQNAGLIRAGRWEQIDTGHLAEESDDPQYPVIGQ